MLLSNTNNVMQSNLRTHQLTKCCVLMLLCMYASHASDNTTVCRLITSLTFISQLQMNSWIWLPLSRQTGWYPCQKARLLQLPNSRTLRLLMNLTDCVLI